MQASGCASTACKGASVHTVCKHRGVQVWTYKNGCAPTCRCAHRWVYAHGPGRVLVHRCTRVYVQSHSCGLTDMQAKSQQDSRRPLPWQPTDGERAGAGGCTLWGGGSTSNLLPHSPKSERCAKPPQGRAPQHLPPQGRQGPPAAPQTPPCCAWGSLRPLNSRVNHSWGRGARAAANPPWPQPGLAGELRPSRRGARRAGGALFMRTDFLCRARGWGGPAAAEGEPDTVGCSGGGPTSSVGLTGL